MKIVMWIAEVLRQRKDKIIGKFWNKKRGHDQYTENEHYEMEYKKRVIKLLRV